MRPHSEIPEDYLCELKALAESVPAGKFVEVGVYKGGSAFVLYEIGRETHLFDTFTGIPLQGPIDQISLGAFSDTSAQEVQRAMPNAVLHVGMFPGTLPYDLTDLAFVHIDCDQYETCKAAIEKLYPRMVQGAIIAFDDYPFPGIQKAIHDYFLDKVKFTKLRIPYVVKE